MEQVSEAELCSSSINGTSIMGRHRLALVLNVDDYLMYSEGVEEERTR